MRKLALLLILLAAGPVWADAHTSNGTGGGAWSNAATWAGGLGVPADTDSVTIAATDTVTFDVDQSAFATGITLTVNGTLAASTTAGAYYLKLQNADMTIAATGTLRAGTDTGTPYPSTCTFTIDHNNNAKSIEVANGGHIYLYCTQPATKYVTTTGALIGGATTEIPVSADVSGDAPWAVASAEVVIVDSTGITNPPDTEILTVASVDATPHVHVSVAPTNNKESGAQVILVTRNVRLINVGASDYAITYAAGAGSGDYLGCEIRNCSRGTSGGTGFTFAGVLSVVGTYGLYVPNTVTVSGVIVGPGAASSYGIYTVTGCTMTGLISGLGYGIGTGQDVSISGKIFGCYFGANALVSSTLASAGIIDRCAYGLRSLSSSCIYGSVTNCTRGITAGSGYLLANATLSGNSTADLDAVGSLVAYNTSFASTEFANYNTSDRAAFSYAESFDHDGTTNAFKAWCKGGIVTSAATDLPTGYTIRYQHAVESASYPCFRQYQATVQPGASIEVDAVIRNTDGIDVSATSPIDLRPRLEIIDVFADPLVDSTQTALATDAIADPDGSDTTWQSVHVIWANQGDSPRQVYVRIICYSHDASTHTIDEAWSIASYQDQISTLYDILIPIKTTVATADTATSFTLTAGQATADVYNNMTLFVQDKDDGHWEQRSIDDWTAGRVITVDRAYGFTPAVGDSAYIMGVQVNDLTPVTDLIGTPVALDGGTATLAGMLTKMADDNAGADFDATMDSLHAQSTTLSVIQAMTDLMAVVTTTVNTVTDANTFTLVAGQDVNEAYRMHAVMVQDATDSHAEVRWVKTWKVGRIVTVDKPLSFTPAPADKAWILGPVYGGLLDQLQAMLSASQQPVYYYKQTTSGGSGGAGGTTYFEATGDDP